MPASRLIDTFPAFLHWWSAARNLCVEAQVDSWLRDYMAPWPELAEKQQSSYAKMSIDWRRIARERVFPHLAERLQAMKQVHKSLLANVEAVYGSAEERLGLGFDVVFIIYVGIGCGAGWADTYGGTPACLFGLENITECCWTKERTLRGLTAHELGHLVHYEWRRRANVPLGSGPWWDLYDEGFAQRAEHLILDAETWHMREGDPSWLRWCRDRRGWLAAEYVKTVERGEPVNRFFGSWFTIEGHSQVGYFLGHEIVRALAQEMGLRSLALLPLDAVERTMRAGLELRGRR